MFQNNVLTRDLGWGLDYQKIWQFTSTNIPDFIKRDSLVLFLLYLWCLLAVIVCSFLTLTNVYLQCCSIRVGATILDSMWGPSVIGWACVTLGSLDSSWELALVISPCMRRGRILFVDWENQLFAWLKGCWVFILLGCGRGGVFTLGYECWNVFWLKYWLAYWVALPYWCCLNCFWLPSAEYWFLTLSFVWQLYALWPVYYDDRLRAWQ